MAITRALVGIKVKARRTHGRGGCIVAARASRLGKTGGAARVRRTHRSRRRRRRIGGSRRCGRTRGTGRIAKISTALLCVNTSSVITAVFRVAIEIIT